MADIKLKNTANTEFSISHNGTRGAKAVTSDQIVVAVETINDFPANPETGDTVIVKDINRGGTFIYDATQSAVNNGGTIFDGWVRQYSGAVNVKWFGLEYGEDNSTTIQAAFDFVASLNSSGSRPAIDYTYSLELHDFQTEISTPIIAKCNFDFSNTLFNFTDNSAYLQIGTISKIEDPYTYNSMKFVLPKLVNTLKVVYNDWTPVSDSVGLKIVNVHGSRFILDLIKDFETGVLIVGDGMGTHSNTLELQTVYNCKIGITAEVLNGGYVTEHIFNGGTIVINGGTTIPNTRYVKWDDFPARIDNMRFFGTNLQGGSVEYEVEDAGALNLFIACRFEKVGYPSANFLYSDTSGRGSGSGVIGGAGSDLVQFHYDPSTTNRNIALQGQTIQGTYKEVKAVTSNGLAGEFGGINLYNKDSSSAAIIRFFAYNTPPQVEDANSWTNEFGSQWIKYKRSDDDYPRIKIGDGGYIQLGDGTAEPTTQLAADGNRIAVRYADSFCSSYGEYVDLGDAGSRAWGNCYVKNYYYVNGIQGATGTFTSSNGKTVTVTGGIITSII